MLTAMLILMGLSAVAGITYALAAPRDNRAREPNKGARAGLIVGIVTAPINALKHLLDLNK